MRSMWSLCLFKENTPYVINLWVWGGIISIMPNPIDTLPGSIPKIIFPIEFTYCLVDKCGADCTLQLQFKYSYPSFLILAMYTMAPCWLPGVFFYAIAFHTLRLGVYST